MSRLPASRAVRFNREEQRVSRGMVQQRAGENAACSTRIRRTRARPSRTPLNFGKPAVQAAHPALLSLGERVHLAWKEFDGEHTHIVAMSSGDGGKNWSAPASLASTADASDSPLLIERKGRVYLSWNTKNEGHRVIEAGK